LTAGLHLTFGDRMSQFSKNLLIGGIFFVKTNRAIVKINLESMDNAFFNSETVSVRYIINNIDASVKFYTELLGFDVVMNPPSGFAMLAKGNLRLLLNEPGAGGAGQSMPDGTVPSAGGWNRIQLQTKDLESAIAALTKQGARFRSGLVMGNGGKQILLLDPSENLIELVEPKDRS
jgi:catechol 2,3-dioxygenase-like lactoylglutathione lyase family enzyme